jgi:peptide deformylase
MEIVTKNDHTKAEGIYAVSRKVKSYKQIREDAEAMVAFFDGKEGNFDGDYKSGYALSHCQMDIGKDPWAFFVVNRDFLTANKDNRPKKDNNTNFFFPSRVIVNAQILEAPERIQVTKPARKIVREGNQVSTKIVLEEAMESNKIDVPEACFSFPLRKSKNKQRYFRVKVRYQYPRKFLGLFPFLWTKTEWVQGLKAHLFQHEIQHAEGKNMYYDK